MARQLPREGVWRQGRHNSAMNALSSLVPRSLSRLGVQREVVTGISRHGRSRQSSAGDRGCLPGGRGRIRTGEAFADRDRPSGGFVTAGDRGPANLLPSKTSRKDEGHSGLTANESDSA